MVGLIGHFSKQNPIMNRVQPIQDRQIEAQLIAEHQP